MTAGSARWRGGLAARRPVIAVIGGTGALGSGLARLWADAGFPIVIGSRSKERAESAARALGATGGAVRGEDNRGAAKAGDVVVLSVPYASHAGILAAIAGAVIGKIVVDAVVPLVPPRVSVVTLPEGGSAAVAAQRVLGLGAQVVSAFHTIGARKLREGVKAEGDVLVFGDDPDAREQVLELAGHVAERAIDGGVLANSVAAEALAAVLISINRRYKVSSAGVRITGLDSTRPAPSPLAAGDRGPGS